MKDHIRRINFKLVVLAVLLGVSGLLFALGLGAFFYGGVISASINYDYTQRLSKPRPICSHSHIVHFNQRLYEFEEHQRAMNVFKDDGTFLFCVRCENATNGGASALITERGIYINSPNNFLHWFDQNGTYLGYAKYGRIYDKDGNYVNSYQGNLRTFTNKWYRCKVYDNETKHTEIYTYSYDGNLLSVKELTPSAEPSDNKAQYYTFLNGLYRKQDGETVLLAKTPLYLTFFHSPLLGFVVSCIGSLCWNGIKPRFQAVKKELKREKSASVSIAPE